MIELSIRLETLGWILSAWKYWFGYFLKNFIDKFLTSDLDKLLEMKGGYLLHYNVPKTNEKSQCNY